MQFIVTDNTSPIKSIISNTKSLLIKGTPELTEHQLFYLPEHFSRQPSTALEYMHKHKDRVAELINKNDYSDSSWTQRTIAMLRDAYCIGYHSSAFLENKHKETSWLLNNFQKFSRDYFLIDAEAAHSSALVMLPAMITSQRGVSLSKVSKEQLIYSLMALESIYDDLEREMDGHYSHFEKSDIQSSESFVYMTDPSFCTTEHLTGPLLTDLINIIVEKMPEKVEILNFTSDPLGSAVDIEDIAQLAIHGYMVDVGADNELVIHSN